MYNLYLAIQLYSCLALWISVNSLHSYTVHVGVQVSEAFIYVLPAIKLMKLTGKWPDRFSILHCFSALEKDDDDLH